MKITSLTVPLTYGLVSLLAGLGPIRAAEDDSKSVADDKKIGWVETVKRDLEGWTVHVDSRLLEGPHQAQGEAALNMLTNHLERIAVLLPEEQLADMRKLEIQIEHAHPELGNMQYHPAADWLKGRGYDPALAKKVHIPQAENLLSRQQMLKHPAVILHELAHAYHDQVLGFDHKETLEAFEAAMDVGIYDEVLSHRGSLVKHYATTDHKEYFAEATESYFYHNDFYPFVAAELQKHDPKGYSLMEDIWGERE